MQTKSPPNVIWTLHKKSGTWHEDPQVASPDFIPSTDDWEDIECRCVPIEEVHDPRIAKIKALEDAITVAPAPPCDGDWESEGGRAAQDAWMAQYSLFLEFSRAALALPSA